MNDCTISKIKLSSVKEQALLPPDNRKEEKYFYVVKYE